MIFFNCQMVPGQSNDHVDGTNHSYILRPCVSGTAHPSLDRYFIRHSSNLQVRHHSGQCIARIVWRKYVYLIDQFLFLPRQYHHVHKILCRRSTVSVCSANCYRIGPQRNFLPIDTSTFGRECTLKIAHSHTRVEHASKGQNF